MQDKPLDSLDPKLLGERLRTARKARSLTQDAAAAQLSYSRTTVVAIEKGERRITPDELLRFAQLYQRPISELINARRQTEPLLPQFRAGLAASQSDAALGESEFFGSPKNCRPCAPTTWNWNSFVGVHYPKLTRPFTQSRTPETHPKSLANRWPSQKEVA